MLEYKLLDNKLTTDDLDDQVGKPVNVKVNREDDLVTAMSGEGSILKKTEIIAVWHNSWHRIAQMVARGEAYSDDFISLSFNISGVFIDKDDFYDPNRHTLAITARLKGNVARAVDSVILKKVDGSAVAPEIEEVYNWSTDTHNDQLTPDGVLEIKGDYLKVYDNLPGVEGVVFIDQANGTEYLQDEFRTNEPKTLTMRVPVLPVGNYRIEVRNTGYKTKTLRTGLFVPVLVVA